MTRVIAFLQPGMADWQACPSLALLRSRFGVQVLTATPDGAPITTCGGLRVKSDVAFDKVVAEGGDAFLLLGSDAWPAFYDTAFFWMLQTAAAQGRVVAAICEGAVALARAGLLAGRAHTSNGRDWLRTQATGYGGEDRYVDSPRAVVDGRIVTAPGSAPGAFAAEVARLLVPDRAEEIRAFERLCAREWIEGSADRATFAARGLGFEIPNE
jgi:putative intracellular protease/amidase